jgi:hypothetical protein
MEILKTKFNSTKTKLYACCPFCESTGKAKDTKFHLYIIPEKFAICFRCGYNTSYANLIKNYRLSINAGEIQPQASLPVEDNFDRDITKNTCAFNSSFYSKGAVAYLLKRKLDESVIARLNIRLGCEDLLCRVVFVDSINRYYVARSFLPNITPKTLNPVVQARPLMYLNKKEYGTLYLVEGTFDMVPFIKTGRDVVALLGKDISSYQLQQLGFCQVNNIVVALDADAVGSAILLIDKICAVKPFTNVGIMTYNNNAKKDPGEWDIELFGNSTVVWYRIINPKVMVPVNA